MATGLLPDELELRKFVCPEFVFGAGARHLVGHYARNLGAQKALVVSDAGVTAAGWTDQVLAALHADGLKTALFADITSNPRVEEVMAGAEAYRKERCNAIVAVGGGSPMDCAKGIGITSVGGQHLLEFEGVDQVHIPPPPLICVPTTAGSSADVSQFAIITDTRRRVKIAIVSKALVPDAALIDPETLTTMAPEVTASSGIDALTHAIEAFVSNAHSPITDLHALAAIRQLVPNLAAAIAHPEAVSLRGATMLGSLEAGLAFSNASLGLVHAMAHSLGGLIGKPHGEYNAQLLPHVIAFNFSAAPDRFARIAEAFGLDVRGCTNDQTQAALVAAINQLRTVIGADQTLGQMGICRADIPQLAAHALQDLNLVTNPRPATRREVEALYEEAL